MKVILNSDVQNIGRKNEIVEVADGYARNYLIPRKLADHATEQLIAQARVAKEKEINELEERMDEVRKALEPLQKDGVSMTAKANEQGHLFAGIHSQTIAEFLSEKTGVEIPVSVVELEQDIKKVGDHTVTVKLGEEDIKVTITVEEEKE